MVTAIDPEASTTTLLWFQWGGGERSESDPGVADRPGPGSLPRATCSSCVARHNNASNTAFPSWPQLALVSASCFGVRRAVSSTNRFVPDPLASAVTITVSNQPDFWSPVADRYRRSEIHHCERKALEDQKWDDLTDEWR